MKSTSIYIRVTREDIRLGKPCETSFCPVARAIRRVLKKRSQKDIQFDGSTATVWNPRRTHYVLFDVPATVSRWVDRFDGGVKKSKPIRFYMTASR